MRSEPRMGCTQTWRGQSHGWAALRRSEVRDTGGVNSDVERSEPLVVALRRSEVRATGGLHSDAVKSEPRVGYTKMWRGQRHGWAAHTHNEVGATGELNSDVARSSF